MISHDDEEDHHLLGQLPSDPALKAVLSDDALFEEFDEVDLSAPEPVVPTRDPEPTNDVLHIEHAPLKKRPHPPR